MLTVSMSLPKGILNDSYTVIIMPINGSNLRVCTHWKIEPTYGTGAEHIPNTLTVVAFAFTVTVTLAVWKYLQSRNRISLT